MSKLMAFIFFILSFAVLCLSIYLFFINPVIYLLNPNMLELSLTFYYMSFFGFLFSLSITFAFVFISKIVYQTAKNIKGYTLFGGIIVIMLITFSAASLNFLLYPLYQPNFSNVSRMFLIHYSLLEIIGYAFLSYCLGKFRNSNENTLRINMIFLISVFSFCLSFIGLIFPFLFDTSLDPTSIIYFLGLFGGYFIPSLIIIIICCTIGFWLSFSYLNYSRNEKQVFPEIQMNSGGKKVCIYIPAYNAAYTLPNLIDRIKSDVRDQIQKIIVIDDHSPDNTYLLAVGLKKEQDLSKMTVFRTLRNQKYGGNQKLGYSLSILEGYDIVVMLHGDAQYAPELIPQIIEPIVKDEADMVFGSRMKMDPLKGGMPPIKYIGNKVLTFIENSILGTTLSEFHSGFRAYSCKALLQVPFLRCTNEFHFDTEIIIQFVLAKLRIAEVPIPTFYGEEVSRVNKLNYGLNILKEIIAYYLISKKFARTDKYDLSTHKFVISDIKTYIEDFMVKID